MIRGVFFIIPEIENRPVLSQILENIHVEKYRWYHIEEQSEVWKDYEGGEFFDKNYYEGNSFLQLIQSEHYVIFLKLQAYFDHNEFYDIHTYEDFQNSKCQILILIADSDIVDIYVKDPMIAKDIYQNAKANNFLDIRYITDSNDNRKKMDVL